MLRLYQAEALENVLRHVRKGNSSLHRHKRINYSLIISSVGITISIEKMTEKNGNVEVN